MVVLIKFSTIIRFSNFRDKAFNCRECNLGTVVYDNIKLLLEKNSTTLCCKSNLTEILKTINDSENHREIIFSFTFKECSHKICIISNDIINYTNLTLRCSICNPRYKYQDKFSFYGFKLMDGDSSVIPKFRCPKNHTIVNPAKWICSFCNIGPIFYQNLIMKTLSNYLETDDTISQYLELVSPTHYTFGENLSGFYDFSVQFNIDTINSTLVKLDSTPSFFNTKTLVSLNFEIDEVSHFTTSHRIKRDEAKNYHNSIQGNNLVRISYKFIDDLFIPSLVPNAIISLLQSALVSILNNNDNNNNNNNNNNNSIFISDDLYKELPCFRSKAINYINLFDYFENDCNFPLDNYKLTFDFSNYLE
ncbi:hypothetical protein ACTFIW_007416 [Dictyostelium discoideum]